jgi:hypothetical protein
LYDGKGNIVELLPEFNEKGMKVVFPEVDKEATYKIKLNPNMPKDEVLELPPDTHSQIAKKLEMQLQTFANQLFGAGKQADDFVKSYKSLTTKEEES